ncbi:MAG: Mth938-like domain-containing protein [Chromatiaceae bacterium]
MKFSQADPGDGYLIEGYEPGRILIDGRFFDSGLILTPRRILPTWGPQVAADLTEAHIDALLDLDPQVILLGTGVRQIFPAMVLMARALTRGIGIEVMDTGAACRTYNILMAEGRQVVAGLLPI